MDQTSVSNTHVESSFTNLDADASTEVQPISKNARKRMMKEQEYEMKKEARKAVRRQKKQERRRKIKLNAEKGIPKPPRRIKPNPSCNVRVVIDLSFNELMTVKELNSIGTQCARLYGSNRRAPKPVKLFMTSYDGAIKERMEKRHPGSVSWKVSQRALSYQDVFADEQDKIVYLTSESENVIEDFKEDEIYVIGGLIDKNRHKGLTHELAQKAGIKTARLPLDKYVSLPTRAVLTVNQVFEIILGVIGNGDWKKTLLESLPKRKGALLKEDVPDGTGGSEEEDDLENGEQSPCDTPATFSEVEDDANKIEIPQ